MNELDQLKQLMLSGDYDGETRADVADLERRLQEAVAKEKLAEHPVIADYIAFLTHEIARCKEVLSEDDKLTEVERNKLFERIRQSRDFLDGFQPGQREIVEQNIKDLLDAARRES